MAGIGLSTSGSESSYSQDVMGEQIPFLEEMWGGASNLWDMLYGYSDPMMSGGVSGMEDALNSMDPYWNMMMGGGVYAPMENQQNYDMAFENLMNPTTYAQDMYSDVMGGEGNDYVDAMGESISTMYQDVEDESLAAMDQRAGLMSGSSPWEVASADIINDSATQEAATLAALGYETFDQDLQNKMEIAEMADANWLASATHAMDTASGTLGAEQATMGSGLDFGNNMFSSAMQQMMLPFQMSMFYPSMMGQPVVLGEGSSSSSSMGGSFGF